MQTGGEAIQGVEAQKPNVTEEVIEVSEVVEDVKESEPVKHESTRETAERAYRELQKQAKQDVGNQDAKGEEGQKAQNAGTKKPSAVAPEQEVAAEDLVAPNRLSLKEKEIFNQLPKELKPSVARLFKEHEARFTKTQQEAARLIDENRGIFDAIRPFAEDIAGRNLTVPQAIAGLLATHKKLTNPETALQKWVEIGADIGVSQEALAPFLQNASTSTQQQPMQSRELQELRQKYELLESRLKQQDAQAFEQSVAPIIAEGQAVANETDNQGRYLWPELHDNEIVAKRVKPLVSALVEALPDLSYGDALKRAVMQLRGQHNGNFQQLNQTRLPTTTQNTRAQAASVSVRGRSAPAVSGSSMPDKIPDSPRDTVALAMKMLRQGA